MVTLPGRLSAHCEDHKLPARGVSIHIHVWRRKVEPCLPSFVPRSGATAVIPAIASLSPFEPTSLPLLTTAKLYLTIFGAGVLAYLLSVKITVEEKNDKECPRCNGTGREVCWCRGWSDGDSSGCQSCNYSGFTACKACRGGGTAVPIPLKIRADDKRSQ